MVMNDIPSHTSVRIGTRRSQLACIQTQMVCDILPVPCEIIPMETTGDKVINVPLWDIGGKGLFSKDLDRALIAKECDICVHSAKDLETHMADGIQIIGFLPRHDVRDVVIGASCLDDLPYGCVLGTSSPRRMGYVGYHRSDIKIVPIRGNVHTRLDICKCKDVDATILAYAGLGRLGFDMASGSIDGMPMGILDTSTAVPACGQGAIAVTCRADDVDTYTFIKPFLDEVTYRAVMCERAFLKGFDGNCQSPIGVYAYAYNNIMYVYVCVQKKRTYAYKIKKYSYGANDAIDKCYELGQYFNTQ